MKKVLLSLAFVAVLATVSCKKEAAAPAEAPAVEAPADTIAAPVDTTAAPVDTTAAPAAKK
jgi:hypothetical protein